ncbi:DUF2272 domain-containing protein [Variovorax sp. J31P207]|uniref:DUF2272 domain-containing protein n=1 Tax=Variovorax sp. J31P207 TaxID=3053510 RepID=UPI002577EB9D|nr:DUF2272 domain-containing protein [Variovorax sp. J31P207]MDM0070042.1 DUF2272 domain-containing protein [Variovorax sp. J31P207]
MSLHFVPRRLLPVAVSLLAMAAPFAAGAASLCLDTATRSPPPPRALAMAAAAEREHRAFGGQAMDAEGRLTESGLSEAEDVRAGVWARAPWERVLGYWGAVDPQQGRLPYLVRFGALRPADRQLLLQALNQATAAHLQGLGVGPDQGLESHELRAAQAAIDRVAVIDTPWSAAFVSWLARQAGLGADEFQFSEAHADYAGAAWQAGSAEAAGRPTAYAMRACDITRTPPRVGDLVCQARGTGAGFDSFEKIGEALAARRTGGGALPMHCDVVVAVDALGFDAIGGNVLQSVTLRRLAFAPGTRRLDPSYLSDGCTAGTADCVDRHMSRQPWSLLLQWR